VVSYLVLGVALIAIFLVVESRHRHPLVPLRLFRSRAVTGSNLMMVLIGSVMFSLFFFLSQFMQNVQGYSPLRAGFAFLPMPLAIIIGTQLSSRLVARLGVRTLLVTGPLVSAVGLLLLSRITADGSYALHVGIPGAIITFGVGMSFVPITLAATNGVDRRDAGLASGLINTTRQIGGSLGLAVLLTIAASRTHAVVGASGLRVAETAGYSRAFEISALLLVAAAVIALTVLPARVRSAAMPAPERSPAEAAPAAGARADAAVAEPAMASTAEVPALSE
jgi:predicted MFS family arabinose efflux permease